MHARGVVAVAFLAATTLAQETKPQISDATLGARPPEGAIVLLDGKSLDAWQSRGGEPAAWTLEDGYMIVKPGSGNIVTRDSFPGDFQLHVEFAVPYMPEAKGQARGNSGIYLQGRYELQVLDSYGLDSLDNDCGGIYKQHKPLVNACKPPLQWQTYDIDFQAPVLEDGKVVKKARATIKQNGVVIHDDVEIEPTPGGIAGDTASAGPILLQDHGNLVQFRNMWILPKK